MTDKTNPKRPVVHYHGGKWRIASWIVSHFPEHRVYVEPFGGGASVLLRKPRCKVEIYNDLDQEIVNVFKTMRSSEAELVRQLKLTPYAKTEFHQAYQPGGDDVERARKTIVKSFMGFGGNGIYTKTGFRSTIKKSSGPEKSWHTYPDELHAAVDRFKGVVIENRPAIEVVQMYDSEETLHYVDPPYLASVRDAGKDYRCELKDNDHVELAEVLHSLKGQVIISGYVSELYTKLFKGWKHYDRDTRASNCALRTERIWIKPA